jgi:hypothetical protein
MAMCERSIVGSASADRLLLRSTFDVQRWTFDVLPLDVGRWMLKVGCSARRPRTTPGPTRDLFFMRFLLHPLPNPRRTQHLRALRAVTAARISHLRPSASIRGSLSGNYQTNPPRATRSSSLRVSRLHVSRLPPDSSGTHLGLTRDACGTHAGLVFYAFLAPPPSQPQHYQPLRTARNVQQDARISDPCEFVCSISYLRSSAFICGFN